MTNACCRPVLQARKQLGRHALHYGLDVNRLDNETQSLSTDRGVTTAVPKGRTPPPRAGAFVQDSIELGRFTLKPGLRYESVDVDADAGSISMGASGATAVSNALMPGCRSWAVSAHGRRRAAVRQLCAGLAPTAGELNNFFGNITPFYGYYILPNPNLKAEKQQLRPGHTRRGRRFQWEAAAFYGKYRNFIERYANAGSVGTSRWSPCSSRATRPGQRSRGSSSRPGRSWASPGAVSGTCAVATATPRARAQMARVWKASRPGRSSWA
jgi:hemoglobin/transferrin/lactoferrin receptor protein